MEYFVGFPKISRLSRDIIITEKLDGTNAQVQIVDTRVEPVALDYAVAANGDWVMLAGSRSRYVVPGKDNYGFASWVQAHADELWGLGVGRHYGEWWGQGINRKYGLTEKRFSLFNVSRWAEVRPPCCHVVPVLYTGAWTDELLMSIPDQVIGELRAHGSYAAPGFMKPEGIVVFHTAGNVMFKKTIENDEAPKSTLA